MAENLWALREQKKLSVAMLASRAGLPIGLIMQYESGQRSIDPRHIPRLARALYVEDSDIKLQSDPRPGSAPMERQPRRPERLPSAGEKAEGLAPAKQRDKPQRPPRAVPALRPPAMARPSQIAHLTDLLTHLGRSTTELENELGKPLAELNRREASQLLFRLQAALREGLVAERHRAYLPEAVDQFEYRYLTAAREEGAILRFSLFDGSTVTGPVVGFSPYTITVRLESGDELTLNKLALVSYQKLAGSGGELMV